MYCLMDVNDPIIREYRIRRCACTLIPARPKQGAGCVCPRCGKTCRQCSGHGWVERSTKQFHRILSAVRAEIARRVRTRGHPPGYVRLSAVEIEVLLNKQVNEEAGHWIAGYVDPGPPLRVFDVLIVCDRRRHG